MSEAEIRQIETKIEQLQNEKVATKNALGRMMAYQKYLETVVEVAEEYHEVNDLLLRYSTLLSTNEDLRTHVEQCTDTIEALRAELQTYYKSAISEILNLENDVTLAKQAYERKKHETAEMEKKMDSILQISAAKTLVRGQACMAAENLFGRVCHNSRINHVPQSSPLRQLDVVGDYVSDTNAIIKAVKAGALKKDEVVHSLLQEFFRLGHFSPVVLRYPRNYIILPAALTIRSRTNTRRASTEGYKSKGWHGSGSGSGCPAVLRATASLRCCERARLLADAPGFKDYNCWLEIIHNTENLKIFTIVPKNILPSNYHVSKIYVESLFIPCGHKKGWKIVLLEK
ncbi:hypothetical protein SELMODRAFT_425324 [Selaginella moellendorffii]|uniref:DUF4200 domain-containing protein n=1 Tax=Selaginella moellendorffii TaxID=88036 RepID=D8SSR2_SELML|nr:hypothetical protein SELMODRAFT_425324 [Selaginella moellendorffii]